MMRLKSAALGMPLQRNLRLLIQKSETKKNSLYLEKKCSGMRLFSVCPYLRSERAPNRDCRYYRHICLAGSVCLFEDGIQRGSGSETHASENNSCLQIIRKLNTHTHTFSLSLSVSLTRCLSLSRARALFHAP